MLNKKPLPINTAVNLTQKICTFLLECGGNYQTITREIQEKILVCLAARQFIIKIDKYGKIKYFCCWFRVHPEDVEAVKNRCLPYDVCTGSIVYVCELANTEGRKGMAEIVDKLHRLNADCNQVFWHRPVKGDKVFYFTVKNRYNPNMQRG